MSLNALYWYLSIFAWAFMTGIGLPPIPEEAGILFAASVNELHPEVWWGIAWAACGLGIVLSDCVLFGVGRWWGPRLFEFRLVQKLLSPERRIRLEGRFARHGVKVILFARFLPPLRAGVFLIAGAMRYSFLKFLIADVAYAVVVVGLYFFFGVAIVKFLYQFENLTLGIVGGGLLLYGLVHYYRLLRHHEAKCEPGSATGTAPTAVPDADRPSDTRSG